MRKDDLSLLTGNKVLPAVSKRQKQASVWQHFTSACPDLCMNQQCWAWVLEMVPKVLQYQHKGSAVGAKSVALDTPSNVVAKLMTAYNGRLY